MTHKKERTDMEENKQIASKGNKLPDSNGMIKFVIAIALCIVGPVILYFNLPYFALAIAGDQAYMINIFGTVIGIAVSLVGTIMLLYSFLSVLLSIEELLWLIVEK